METDEPQGRNVGIQETEEWILATNRCTKRLSAGGIGGGRRLSGRRAAEALSEGLNQPRPQAGTWVPLTFLGKFFLLFTVHGLQ